jgi:predicted ATPase/DNA-binding CsgD family transcriptional regulator
MPPHNVKAQLTTFVGRDAELHDVRRLIDQYRLVTLTGVGGAGKTRLAEHIGHQLDDGWPDGFWLVDLASIGEPEEVGRLAAATVGALVEPGGDAVQALAVHLAGRRLLLCLDTCEHVLQAVADLAETVLPACPTVAFLATSREPLGVKGELVWRMPPMGPAEAVALFADRAQLVAPGFDVAAVRAEVEWICVRVDGIPLAIELAAAWVRALSPRQIAAGLTDSLRMLTGTTRALPRHQTLVASIGWSHALLAPEEQVFFRRLAVFSGPFTVDAAAQVCAEPSPSNGGRAGQASDGYVEALHVVGRLMDKSLVAVQEHGSEVRFRLLDTIRQYAEQRLLEAGEATELRDRHLDYYVRLVLDAAPGSHRDQDQWRTLLDGLRENVNAALRWGLTEPHERAHRARRLAAEMVEYWLLRGQATEGLEFLRRATELAPEDRSAVQGRLLVGTAMLAMVSGCADLLASTAAAALDIATAVEDDAARARALAMSAYPLFFRDFAACQAAAAEAQVVGEAAGEPFGRDWAAVIEGYSLQTRGRNEEALGIARRAFESSWARNDRFCAAFARGIEVYVLLMTGHVREAEVMGQNVAEIVRPLGDYFAVGTNTCTAAHGAILSGHLTVARRLLEPVGALAFFPGADVVGFMVPYGLLHLWEGDLEGAVSWFERGVRRMTDENKDWTAVRCLPGLIGALRRLGRVEEAKRWAARAVPAATAFDAPYELSGVLDEQALMMRDLDLDVARTLHLDALMVRRDRGLRTCYVDSIDALAWLEMRAGRPADAARLLGASDAGREAMGYPRPPVELPDHDALVARVRTGLGDNGYDAAWQEGAARTPDDVVTALTRGRGPRNRTGSGWDRLTPTEMEVVALVRRGLTNPEIARRMYVSRSTVKAHLTHIFAKVEVANRTELALLVAQRESNENPTF